MINQLHINKYLFALAMLLLNSIGSSTAQADELKGIFSLGSNFGGATLATLAYTDGTTTDIKVNNSLAMNVGAVRVDESFETQATIGYQFSGPIAKDGSISWNAIPVELIEFYRVDLVRMGLGLSYNINPQLTIKVPGTNKTYSFENAFGTIVQIDWSPPKQLFNIAFRYTAIEYKQSGVNNPRGIGGNAAGIYINYYF